MKRILFFYLFAVLCSTVFSQSTDDKNHKNWKEIEEVMFSVAQRCIAASKLLEGKEDADIGTEVRDEEGFVYYLEKVNDDIWIDTETTYNGGIIACIYEANEKLGDVQYWEPAVSYPVESGFNADLSGAMGRPTVINDGALVYNSWNWIERWFHSASRVLQQEQERTTIFLGFSAESVERYGYK